MSEFVLVWDLETIPDLACVARVTGLADGDDEGARAALGDKFPKLLFHRVACIGALVAERVDGVWNVRSLGAPNVGERTEAELLQSFVDRIEAFKPQMVTFNGSSFDLPVLRYRAMINRVSAPGLECRRYWYRYSDDCLDLCDALASYSPGGKISLHELCRALGFAGKPDGMDGGEVDRYVQEGRIGEVAAYCETDVVNTYRVWLVYELFRGTLMEAEFDASEINLFAFMSERAITKPHLQLLVPSSSSEPAWSNIREQAETRSLLGHTATTTNNKRLVSRKRLERLRDELLKPLRTTPPTIGTYPRELDLELFELFGPPHALVQREKRVSLGGRDVRPPRNEWAYEVDRFWMSDIVDWTSDRRPIVEEGWVYAGKLQDDGTFVRMPDISEVPHYTSDMDDALALKHSVTGLQRRLVVEELEDDYFEPRWRAKMLISGQVVAHGETYDGAGAIVLVLVSDLLANQGASSWIEVNDP